jgi:hypothetical protein
MVDGKVRPAAVVATAVVMATVWARLCCKKSRRPRDASWPTWSSSWCFAAKSVGRPDPPGCRENDSARGALLDTNSSIHHDTDAIIMAGRVTMIPSEQTSVDPSVSRIANDESSKILWTLNSVAWRATTENEDSLERSFQNVNCPSGQLIDVLLKLN